MRCITPTLLVWKFSFMVCTCAGTTWYVARHTVRLYGLCSGIKCNYKCVCMFVNIS